jgi:signal transduction histidine kinase
MQASRLTLVGVAAVGVVSVAAATWLPLSSPYLHGGTDNPATIAIFAAQGLVWLLAAVVTLARQPANPLWRLILAYLLVAWLVWSFQFVPYPIAQGLAANFAPMSIALFIHLLVAYPSGHLRARFDRGLVVFTYITVVGLYLLNAATWKPATNCGSGWCPENVLLIWPNNELAGSLVRAGQFAVPIVGGLVLYAIWRHWRAAPPAARRALLPVVIAVPVAYLINSVGRLQIEPLASVFGRFHAVELALGAIVPGGLLLGVLRLQLDRGRVAGLVVELGRGVAVGGLRDVLARALGDPTLQLAFAAPNGGGYIDGAGLPIEVTSENPDRAVAPIERGGRALAILVHDKTIDDENPGLVDAVSNAARLAIENEHLTAQVRAQLEEVRASRARIVEAGDEERRKVERDLHDGAQQRLVALAMRLEQARATAAGSTQLIDEVSAELRAAIAEVRGLARGLYPPILTDAGLAAAVDSLAERATIPVDVRMPAQRFPAAIEVTAYLVVAEALTNVARHSGATMARVDATVVDDVLSITIADDGRGGTDPNRGTGLRGLRDRVAAIGGSLEIVSPSGEGTVLQADLPMAGGRK